MFFMSPVHFNSPPSAYMVFGSDEAARQRGTRSCQSVPRSGLFCSQLPLLTAVRWNDAWQPLLWGWKCCSMLCVCTGVPGETQHVDTFILALHPCLLKKKKDVKNECNGAKEAHFWTSSRFLSAMKQCMCVSEHVWMSSVPEKAESVKRSTAWAKREWDGGLALTRLYTFWKHRESGKHHGGYRLMGAAPWLASINLLEMALQRKISEAQKIKAESTSNICHIRSHFIWEKMICYKPTSF